MNKVIATCLASMFALASVSALAADLTPDERTELRQRADSLQAQRQRNPGWDGGTSRLSQTRGDVKLNQNQGEVKNPKRSGVKAKAKAKVSKGKRMSGKAKMKHAAKTVPGALVRR